MSTFEERQKQFKKAIQEAVALPGERTRFTDAYGVSNSAKIVHGGLFVFNANFDKFNPETKQVVVHCLVRVPPADELFFALVVRSDIEAFSDALDAMRAAGAKTASATTASATSTTGGGDADSETDEAEDSDPAEGASADSAATAITYTANNKNVKGYLALDGRLYLRNKKFWESSLPEDLSGFHSVAIDDVYFAAWPTTASAQRSLLTREYVGYLGEMTGIEKLHEVRPWPDESVSGLMRRMPASIPLSEISDAITSSGGHYPNGEIQKIHASLNFHKTKHFAILAGLSGTGKTQLAMLYANAVHGVTDPSKHNPFQIICPVRPDWTDPTGLTGYQDVLTGRYAVPPFLDAILLATAHRDSPVFVILDEMNLAPVEYYLADVLSAIETGKPLRLHPHSVPLEGTNGTQVPPTLPVPPNLFIIGTINVDETTHSISDKVLDRAMLIDMSLVEMVGYIDKLKKDDDLRDSCEAIGPTLINMHTLLSEYGLGFGYRVAKEVISYHAFSAKGGTDLKMITDDLMTQKVFAKLRGGRREKPLLDELLKATLGMPAAQKMLERQLADVIDFGSFRAGR